MRARVLGLSAIALATLVSCPNGSLTDLFSRPPSPTGLTVGSPTQSSLVIRWSSSIGAGSYEVFRSIDSPLGLAMPVFDGSDDTFIDTGLFSNTTYYYSVRAIFPEGSSSLSGAVSGTTLPIVHLAADVNPGTGSGNPTNLVSLDNALYFAASDAVNGPQLRRFDGTALSAVSSLPGFSPAYLAVFGGKLYMQALVTSLYSYDGMTLAPANPAVSKPRYLLAVNRATLYLSGWDSTYGQELWSDDGSKTAARVADINPGSGSSDPAQLVVMNGTLYFSATDGAAGRQLYRYDGPSLGATMVGSPLSTGTNSGADAVPTGAPIVVLGSRLCFPGTPTGAAPYYLYASDGATTPTVVSTSIQVSLSAMVVYDGALYLRATDGTHGFQLYRYDGASLTQAAAINPGGDSLAPSVTFGVYNGALYFGATADGTNYQLYKYDGTNVTQVYTFNAALAANPGQFAVCDNKLYFSGWDSTNGTELWVLY